MRGPGEGGVVGGGRQTSRKLMVVLATTLALALLAGPSSRHAAADANESPTTAATFASLTAGDGHTCGLLTSGLVKCWGRNVHGQLGLGDKVARGDGAGEMGDHLPVVPLGNGWHAVALAAGFDHTCALLDDGSVRCWGGNAYGQLGLGDTSDRGDAPGEMGDALPAVALGTGRTATAITAGDHHTCALLDDGSVKCWGRNAMGQLGLGDKANRGDAAGEMGDALPVVPLGAGRTATAISGGTDHTCALLDDASLKCWGGNGYGQLGLGDVQARGDAVGELGDALAAVDLGAGRHAVAVSAATLRTCALLDDGSVKCWGYNLYGQLGAGDKAPRGDGPGEMGAALAPVPLPTGRTAVALSVGEYHTCVLLDDTSVRCWGLNGSGQLGLGDKANRGDEPGELGDALPAVALGTGRHAVGLTTGGYHTCARLEDGSLRCWGSSAYGQLGLGDTNNRGDGANELGDHLPVVDLGNPAGPPSGIGGRVLETPGSAPVAGAFVAALGQSDLTMAGGAVTAADGTFRILLPTGTYFVYLLDVTSTHGSRFYGSPTAVTVTSTALVFVDATMAKIRGRLTGTVVERVVVNPREAPPIPGAWAIELSTTGQGGRGQTANSIGWFGFEDLPVGSRYAVFVDPSAAHAPQFWYQAATMATAQVVDVQAAGTTQIQGWLDRTTPPTGGAALTGTVTEEGSGLALPGIYVIALRADTYGFARGATTDAAGHYALDLDPGTYRLELYDPTATHAMEWYDGHPSTGMADADAVTAPGTADAALAPSRGALAGTVTDGSTGDPLAGTWVVAISASGGIAGGAVSAADGAFAITGLSPGTYHVTYVDPTGARPQEYWPESPTYDGSTPLVVAAGATVDADDALG